MFAFKNDKHGVVTVSRTGGGNRSPNGTGKQGKQEEGDGTIKTEEVLYARLTVICVRPSLKHTPIHERNMYGSLGREQCSKCGKTCGNLCKTTFLHY